MTDRGGMQPVNVRSFRGEVVNLDPGLVLAIVRTGDDASDVWRLDTDGVLEAVCVRAEAAHLLAALNLDDE